MEAKRSIQETKKEVQIVIERDAEKIAMYKKHLHDIEKAAEEKNLKMLRDNFFIEQVTTVDNKTEESEPQAKVIWSKKEVNFKKKKDPTSYRWAFGQKIPVDGEWVV